MSVGANTREVRRVFSPATDGSVVGHMSTSMVPQYHLMHAHLSFVELLFRIRSFYVSIGIDVSDVYFLFISVSMNMWVEYARVHPFSELWSILGRMGVIGRREALLVFFFRLQFLGTAFYR